ncbi:MAG TPA: response regulator, partial [bacterium]|nr:response regulator [bacterium]
LLGATDGYQVGDEMLKTIQTSSLLAIPLVTQERVIGQMIIDYEGSPIPMGLAKMALENLAVVAASALERSVLMERASTQTESLARLSRQIEETQRQLQHSERLASIGTLAAGAAHEINNPLAVISAKAQIMQRKATEQDQVEGYRIIIEQTKRIAKIIADLMGFARPTDPQAEPVSIKCVVERSLALVENRIALADIVVNTDFPDNLPLILGDPNQLDQVLLNLFVNAQQAMQKGGEITVKADQSEDGKFIRVRFSDTGRGIPQKHLHRIFDPFFTTKKQGEGMGLGLAVSHKIIETHGGQMSVESTVGVGTTFTLMLPISQSAQIREIQSELLKSTPTTIQRSADNKGRILIVDDESHIRETLEGVLKEEGYEVDNACDGVEGLQKILDGNVDLVLLDIRMPHRDGLEVLEGIKESFRRVPVIIVTGLAAEKEIKECLDAGAIECIRKPFVINEVLQSVRKALKESRRQNKQGMRPA